MTARKTELLAGLLLAAATLGAGCGEEAARVRVVLAADVRAAEPPLVVEPGRLLFHVVGTPRAEAWRGEPLPDGAWRPVALRAERVRAGEVVAEGALPPGGYDFVWLDATTVTAAGRPVLDIVEPIGWPRTVAVGDRLELTLELVVVESATRPGEPAALAKRVRTRAIGGP